MLPPLIIESQRSSSPEVHIICGGLSMGSVLTVAVPPLGMLGMHPPPPALPLFFFLLRIIYCLKLWKVNSWSYVKCHCNIMINFIWHLLCFNLSNRIYLFNLSKDLGMSIEPRLTVDPRSTKRLTVFSSTKWAWLQHIFFLYPNWYGELSKKCSYNWSSYYLLRNLWNYRADTYSSVIVHGTQRLITCNNEIGRRLADAASRIPSSLTK